MCSSNFPAAVGPQSLQVYKPCPSRLLPVRLRKQVVTQTSIHLEGMPRHPNCLKKTRCTPSAHFVSLLLESSQDLGAQIKRLEAIVEKLANQVGIHFHLVVLTLQLNAISQCNSSDTMQYSNANLHFATLLVVRMISNVTQNHLRNKVPNYATATNSATV